MGQQALFPSPVQEDFFLCMEAGQFIFRCDDQFVRLVAGQNTEDVVGNQG
jgi:hypothetical protein